MYMLTEREEAIALDNIDTFVKYLSTGETKEMNPEVTKTYFYILLNALERNPLPGLNFNSIHSYSSMKHVFETLIKYNKCNVLEAPVIHYTTGEISKFFGVSITTIHNWIEEGRLTGVDKYERNKQVRIASNAVWKAQNGTEYTISEIVRMYNEEQDKLKAITKGRRNKQLKTDLDYILDDIKFFESKYNGTYENTLKGKENRTYEEDRDAHEWSFLLGRVKNYDRA